MMLSGAHLVHLKALIIVLLITLLCTSLEGATITRMDICGVDLNSDLTCKRPVGLMPYEIHIVCETCGEFWGNIPGLTYCCLCSDKIFDFCLQAVSGYGR